VAYGARIFTETVTRLDLTHGTPFALWTDTKKVWCGAGVCVCGCVCVGEGGQQEARAAVCVWTSSMFIDGSMWACFHHHAFLSLPCCPLPPPP
jgi:hypothetical protein